MSSCTMILLTCNNLTRPYGGHKDASAARSTAGCGAARLLLGLDMRHRLG